MRVLIVEDEPRMAGLVRRGLVEEGHAADVAAQGEDAVWMAEAHPYDAIVLDVMLPGMTGFETCRRLRNAGGWTPVLMLPRRAASGETGRRSSSLPRSSPCSRPSCGGQGRCCRGCNSSSTPGTSPTRT